MEHLFQMTAEIDNTDAKVLEALKENGRATVREISKELRIPITTAHNRLKKLIKYKIIKKFTIEPDFEKLGKGVLAIVFTSLNHEKLENDLSGLKKKLHGFEEVVKVYVVTGEIDLILIVRVANIKELDALLTRKLRNIKGILKTTTQIVMEEE